MSSVLGFDPSSIKHHKIVLDGLPDPGGGCKHHPKTFINSADQIAQHERKESGVWDSDKQGLGKRTECTRSKGVGSEDNEIGSGRGNANFGAGTCRGYGNICGASERSDYQTPEANSAVIETLNTWALVGSLDTVKNNSNEEREELERTIEERERISEIIKKYEIQFVTADRINHKWAARDKIKLTQWWLENFVLTLDERNELREDIEEALKIEYSEDLCRIDHKSGTLQRCFRQIEFYKRLDAVLEEVEFEKIDLAAYAKREFKSYLDMANKRYRIWKKEDALSIGRLQTRFSPGYTKKVRASLNQLLLNERYCKDGVFVTLTLDPKKYSSRYEMFKDIKSQENRFLTRLFKETGRIPYISTLEVQKNGNPHLHILFLGVKRLLDWRKIRDMWGLGHVWINKNADGKHIRRPLGYMYKYITKAVDMRNNENNLTQSLLWLFHIRSYSTSRGLVKPLNDITRGDIELLGIMRANGTPLLVIQTNLPEIIKELMKREIELMEDKPPPEDPEDPPEKGGIVHNLEWLVTAGSKEEIEREIKAESKRKIENA